MARRVDSEECRRVVSVLIKHTTPDSWLMASDNGWPWLGEWLRRAVLCIHWQRKRIEDLQAQVKRLKEQQRAQARQHAAEAFGGEVEE